MTETCTKIIEALRESASPILQRCNIYPVFVRDRDDDTLPYIVVYSKGGMVEICKDGFTGFSDTVGMLVCAETYEDFCAICNAVAADAIKTLAEDSGELEVTACTLGTEEYDEDKSGYFREITVSTNINI